MINIVYKTPEAENSHIAYAVAGNYITFGDDEKTLNLSKYERDDAVHLIDSIDADGNLVGSSAGLYYAYEIDIPARQYTDADSGETDDDANEVYTPTPVPFSMDNCTLTLWAI